MRQKKKMISYGRQIRSPKKNNLQSITQLRQDPLVDGLMGTSKQDFQLYLNGLLVSQKNKKTAKSERSKGKDPLQHRQKNSIDEGQFQTKKIIQNTTPLYKPSPTVIKKHEQGLEETNFTRIRKNNYTEDNKRYPTQEGQIKFHRNQYPSILYSSDQDSAEVKNSGERKPSLIDGIDDYIASLEGIRQGGENRDKRKKVFLNSLQSDEDIRNTEQILEENIKLRKKLKKYENVITELQDSLENHLNYCRKKEKTNKIKKNELAGSLGKALIKVSEQQQYIDILKTELKSYRKKQKQEQQRYFKKMIIEGDGSSVEDEQEYFDQSLTKKMRYSRPLSEDKIKKKKSSLNCSVRQYLFDRNI